MGACVLVSACVPVRACVGCNGPSALRCNSRAPALPTVGRCAIAVWQFHLDTPLHFAAAGGHESVVTYLLSKGADKTMFNRVRGGGCCVAGCGHGSPRSACPHCGSGCPSLACPLLCGAGTWHVLVKGRMRSEARVGSVLVGVVVTLTAGCEWV